MINFLETYWLWFLIGGFILQILGVLNWLGTILWTNGELIKSVVISFAFSAFLCFLGSLSLILFLIGIISKLIG